VIKYLPVHTPTNAHSPPYLSWPHLFQPGDMPQICSGPFVPCTVRCENFTRVSRDSDFLPCFTQARGRRGRSPCSPSNSSQQASICPPRQPASFSFSRNLRAQSAGEEVTLSLPLHYRKHSMCRSGLWFIALAFLASIATSTAFLVPFPERPLPCTRCHATAISTSGQVNRCSVLRFWTQAAVLPALVLLSPDLRSEGRALAQAASPVEEALTRVLIVRDSTEQLVGNEKRKHDELASQLANDSHVTQSSPCLSLTIFLISSIASHVSCPSSSIPLL